MFLTPSGAIMLCVLSINFIGDGLRDSLGPRSWRQPHRAAEISVRWRMTLLRVRNLSAEFASDRGIARAVQGVWFGLAEGVILEIVGESSSGKSVTAMSIMGLLAEPPAKISVDGLTSEDTALLGLTEAEACEVRGARIGMVFQDPMSSLIAVLTVGRQLTEVL